MTAADSPAITAPRLRSIAADSPFVRFMPAPSPKALSSKASAMPDVTDTENVAQQQQAPLTKKQAAFASRAGRRSTLREASGLAKERAALKEAKALEAARKELEDRGEEWGDDEWSHDKELALTRTIAKKVKSPTPPQLGNQLNVFLGAGLPAPATAPKALAAPDWEALPAGTKLRVWWAGNEEYFECTIKDWHVAVAEDGGLFYTHRCEYDGGTFDHDLSKASFEVIEVAACNAQTRRFVSSLTPRLAEMGLARTALHGATPKHHSIEANLSPRRKWLAQQEAQLNQFAEELEQADIGTPVDAAAAGLRGRLALRRMRQPGLDTPKTPRAATRRPLDDAPVTIVDPSDSAITYRLPAYATPAAARAPERDSAVATNLDVSVFRRPTATVTNLDVFRL